MVWYGFHIPIETAIAKQIHYLRIALCHFDQIHSLNFVIDSPFWNLPKEELEF